jgi:hypothetical protein
MVAELIGVQIQKNNFKQQLILHSPALYNFQETIFVSNHDYNNQQIGDEIALNNELYDILSIEKCNEGYYLKVFNDDLDQKLESLLNQQSEENQPTKNTNKKSVQNIQLFVESFLDFQYPTLEGFSTYPLLNQSLIQGFKSNPFLPPKAC